MVVIISELEVVRMRMGRMLRVLLGDVVDFRIGARVMAKVCLELLGGVVPAHVTGPRRRRRQVGWDLAGMVAAVISEIGAGRVAFGKVTMGPMGSLRQSTRAVLRVGRVRMKDGIGWGVRRAGGA